MLGFCQPDRVFRNRVFSNQSVNDDVENAGCEFQFTLQFLARDSASQRKLPVIGLEDLQDFPAQRVPMGQGDGESSACNCLWAVLQNDQLPIVD